MRDKKHLRPPSRIQSQDILEHALTLHQAGRLDDAESLYREVLQQDADNADALHLLGMVAFQSGKPEHARGLIEQAVMRQPNNFAIHNNLGLVLRDCGRAELAEACFRRALQIKPDYADALLNLGALMDDSGHASEAEACYGQVLVVQPECVPAWNNRGRLLLRHGRFEAAIGDFLEALARKPHQVDAYANLGVALTEAGKPAEAVPCLEQAILYRPDSADIHFSLAVALERVGQSHRAEQSYQKAVGLEPSHAAALNNLGLLASARGDRVQARECFERATDAAPNFAEARCNLAELLRTQDEWEAASEAYERTVALKADWPEAWNNLGIVRRALGRTEAAIAAFQCAIALRPEFADAQYNLGNALYAASGASKNPALEGDARACYERALAIHPLHAGALYNLSNLTRALPTAIALCERAVSIQADFPEAWTALMSARLKACDWRALEATGEHIRKLIAEQPGAMVGPLSVLQFSDDPALQLQCARNWVRNKLEPAARRSGAPFVHARGARPRLRIGYLSGDFRDHAVGNLLLDLFAQHERSRFTVFGYCIGPDDDSPVRRQLCAGFDHFLEARTLSSRELAQRIYRDQIDILVDLTGHTENTRSEVLALRPAPIQVNYLGYPGSMGATFVDYILGDRFLIPDAATCDEKVVYLPGCFQVNPTRFGASPIAAPTRAELGLPEDALVFCCFNSSYKIQPEMFQLWMELLRDVPGSVLWLARFNDFAMENLRHQAAQRNVAPQRLIFAPVVPLHDHLRRLPAADLFLDTTPYSAGATASHTLWAGVPLLTLAGRSYVSRMAGSLLHAIDCAELITASLAEYRSCALTLARDPRQRTELRQRIARKRSRLFDCARFTAGLENAFTAMWQRFEQDLPPVAIDLTVSTQNAKSR